MAVCAMHYAVVSVVTFSSHDLLLYLFVSNMDDDNTSKLSSSSRLWTRDVNASNAGSSSLTSLFACDNVHSDRRPRLMTTIALYATWLLVWRLIFHQLPYRHCVLYEYCWLCNVTLVLSAASLCCQRPVIAGAYCVTVGIDQLLWVRRFDCLSPHGPLFPWEFPSTFFGRAPRGPVALPAPITFGPFPCCSMRRAVYTS